MEFQNKVFCILIFLTTTSVVNETEPLLPLIGVPYFLAKIKGLWLTLFLKRTNEATILAEKDRHCYGLFLNYSPSSV